MFLSFNTLFLSTIDHWGDSNDAPCAVRVHCIPLHAKTCCRPSISTVISCLGDDSKITSIIFTAIDHIHGRQQCFTCDGIQSTRTTAQVASFESPVLIDFEKFMDNSLLNRGIFSFSNFYKNVRSISVLDTFQEFSSREIIHQTHCCILLVHLSRRLTR